jgi:hypothetical protein
MIAPHDLHQSPRGDLSVRQISARSETSPSNRAIARTGGKVARCPRMTADDLAEIDRIVPPGAASGPRYPIGRAGLLHTVWRRGVLRLST